MNKIELYNEKTFDDIKHKDKYGDEYWLARELQNVLGYKRWDKFCNVIKNAQKACENSNYEIFEHFSQVGKTSKIPNAGVKNFDKFHNAWYEGLYNGETANDIAKRKGLRYREEILDNMGSEELADNLFRIVQTESKLKRDNIEGEYNACITHKEVGKIVRKAIEEAGGTMPEDLPTPEKSIKQLEKERQTLASEEEQLALLKKIKKLIIYQLFLLNLILDHFDCILYNMIRQMLKLIEYFHLLILA